LEVTSQEQGINYSKHPLTEALAFMFNIFTSSLFKILRAPFFVPYFIVFYYSLMNEVVHTSPTIGSNVEEVVWKNIHFLMWDIGGQESLRSAWNTYYTNAQVG
jgi:GTPase SAR1 family protein